MAEIHGGGASATEPPAFVADLFGVCKRVDSEAVRRGVMTEQCVAERDAIHKLWRRRLAAKSDRERKRLDRRIIRRALRYAERQNERLRPRRGALSRLVHESRAKPPNRAVHSDRLIGTDSRRDAPSSAPRARGADRTCGRPGGSRPRARNRGQDPDDGEPPDDVAPRARGTRQPLRLRIGRRP
jgi:hypothetical protein